MTRIRSRSSPRWPPRTVRRRDVSDPVRVRGSQHALAFQMVRSRRCGRDLHEFTESSEAYTQIFTRELPNSLYARRERSGADQSDPRLGDLQPRRRGLPGADRLLRLGKVCNSRGILPGMRRSSTSAMTNAATWRGNATAVTSPPRRWEGRHRPDGRVDALALATVDPGTVSLATTCRSTSIRRDGRLTPLRQTLLRRLGAIESARGPIWR